MDYTVLIGGEAGQGIQTIGGMLSKVFARAGFHVFSHQDYMSRIRGGHNFYQIRFSDTPIHSSKKTIDLLVALNLESIEIHSERLSEHGMVVYDKDFVKKTFDGDSFLHVPFEGISKDKTGTTVMANTVATASVLGMLGMEPDLFEEIIKETFKKKGEDVISKNIEASRAGYDYAVTKCLKCNFSVPLKAESGRMLINGNQAIGLSAVASGCRFYSAYPMTPSTGIMIYIASKAKDFGIVVEQAEDEISAINMALGASFAGVRAMTGTSGGGFALMVEGLSLAGMTETPIVIAEVQRPGPATGLPTRTEQADLLFLLHAGHGEFPRVVFAPGNPEQAFYLTSRAFELAEKYQIPVLILSDQYLADSQWSYEGLDLKRLNYKDYRIRGEDFRGLKEYRRHQITENGVSPLAVPGDAEHVVVTDSDEHDEDGHIIEDSETRTRMVRKRLKKLDALKKEVSPPELYGAGSPEYLLIGWGSTYGLLRDAVDRLSRTYSIGMLHFSQLYPFPDDREFLKVIVNAKKTILVEQNATAQFSRYFRAETGISFDEHILKYDGRPFMIEELTEEVTKRI